MGTGPWTMFHIYQWHDCGLMVIVLFTVVVCALTHFLIHALEGLSPCSLYSYVLYTPAPHVTACPRVVWYIGAQIAILERQVDSPVFSSLSYFLQSTPLSLSLSFHLIG